MEKLRIYVDFLMPADAFGLLKEGTSSHELVFPTKPATSVLTRAEPDEVLDTANIAFGQPEPDRVLRAPHLRWVHISTSGITRYDNPEFRAALGKRGIPLTNSASVYNEACAVHALAFMLAEARKLPGSLKSRSPNGSDEWLGIRQDSKTLRGETVLIIGYGAIGQRLAELLGPFGMKVLAYRRRPKGDEAVPVVGAEGLPSAMASADHVINILPDSPETRLFFNSTRFNQMKPGAVFYNIGRGTTVDQDALLLALRSNHFRAAWLDVTDPEPLPVNHPLRAESNCYITPHVAGGHGGEASTLVRHFLQNLGRFTRGEPLLDRVM